MRRIDSKLMDLLRFDEVLGAMVLSRDGLTMGVVGVDRGDSEMVGALTATLIGTADTTMQHLGAGRATGITIRTTEGMLHLRLAGDFVAAVFTEFCNAALADTLCDQLVGELAEMLDGLAA